MADPKVAQKDEAEKNGKGLNVEKVPSTDKATIADKAQQSNNTPGTGPMDEGASVDPLTNSRRTDEHEGPQKRKLARDMGTPAKEGENVVYTLIDPYTGTVGGAIEAAQDATVIETEKYKLPVSRINSSAHGAVPVIFAPQEIVDEIKDADLYTPDVFIGYNQEQFKGLAMRDMAARYIENKDADKPQEKVVRLDESYREERKDEEVKDGVMPPPTRRSGGGGNPNPGHEMP